MNLQPDTPVCSNCLGQGYAVRWCYTCRGLHRATDHFDHEEHHTSDTGLAYPCPACKGSGKLEDQIRVRFLRRIKGEPYYDLQDARALARWSMGMWAAAQQEHLLGKFLCSNSQDADTTSLPLISKLPGGKTTP